MSLWDTVENIFTGGGKKATDKGYDTANANLYPYAHGGINNYNEIEDYAKNWGNNLNHYGNPGDWMYNQINKSPMDYYNSIMGGYSESPEAKYEQEQAYNASTRGASASGMLGSGAQLKGLQQNANDISQRDRQQYYNNVMGANQAQMGYLNNLQDQQAQYRNMMQYLTSLGYGANSGMGQNSINQGIARGETGRQTVGDIMSLFGFGSGGGLFGKGTQENGQNGNGIDPATMAKLMMMFGGG